ncbi:T-complex protein 1 subunit eta [Tupaia chinensis]|uniref:T-complex protein 1 subunit eta n=1 Tax=Tupaia chinensis TaxID=246437 RepID=L9LBF7_TUPCH|nr:T-complex protein 1 subunit eta [Tupaia chinensis]
MTVQGSKLIPQQKALFPKEAVVDAEWNILYDKLERIHHSGAKVVLSKLPTGVMAAQCFANRDMFCAGQVSEEDLKRTMMACRGSIQTSVNTLLAHVLDSSQVLRETKSVARDTTSLAVPRPKHVPSPSTVVLSSLWSRQSSPCYDAIMIVRRAVKNDLVVAGGSATEIELSKYAQDYSRTIPGKWQLLIGAYAKAWEIIPRQLCDNPGFNATNVLNKLWAQQAQGSMWNGVDINNKDFADNIEALVWDPVMVQINALIAASEAVCLIVSIDETIKIPSSTVDAPPAAGKAEVLSIPIERHPTSHLTSWQVGCRHAYSP